MLRTAAALIMYHGTASGKDGEVLRKILKMGFDPSPSKRIFEVPKDGSEGISDWSEQLETFGGSYFTDDFYMALEYGDIAYNHVGGQRLLIIARIETRTPHVTIDEDHFLRTVDLKGFNLKPAYEEREGFYSNIDLWEDYLAGKVDVGPELKKIVEERIKEHRLPITPEELYRYEEELLKMYELALEYAAARDWYGEKEDRDVRLKQLDVRDPQTIISEYRDVANALYVKLHKVTDPVSGEPRNVRSMEPVTYRGKNRIVGILGWAPKKRESYSLEGTVYYDKDPAVMDAIHKLNSIYTQSGKPTKWTDSKGRELSELTGKRRTWAAVDYEDYLLQEVVNYLKEHLWERYLEYPDSDEKRRAVKAVLTEDEQDLLKEAQEACGESCPSCAEAVLTYLKEQKPEALAESISWDFGIGDVIPKVHRILTYAVSRSIGRYIDAAHKFVSKLPLDEDDQDSLADELMTAETFLYRTTDEFEDHPIIEENITDKLVEYDLDMDASDLNLDFTMPLPYGNIDGAMLEAIDAYFQAAAYADLESWIFDNAERFCEPASTEQLQLPNVARVVKEGMTMKKIIANPYWWGPAEEDFAVDQDTCIPVADILEAFDEMLDIQCSDGNWNFDPYMHGMANGMVFLRSIIDGQDPDYLEAPDVWLADLPDDGLPPTVADECYQDEMGNEVCEGEPVVEDPSLAIIPFEEAAKEDMLEADDDKVYFTKAGARPRGLDFIYPKADEPWRPPSSRRRDSAKRGRLPFKRERKRKEDHPTIVETCGRNYILPECREEFEKGFNYMTAALRPFIRMAMVPHEDLEDATWRVVDSHSDPLTDTEMYGTGPYEVIHERESFGGWEGEGTIEVDIAGITYSIDLDWTLSPDAGGPKDVDLQVWVKGGPEDLKLEMRDGSVTTAKEYFTTYVPQLIWDYDLARELFPPPGEPEYEDPRIPSMATAAPTEVPWDELRKESNWTIEDKTEFLTSSPWYKYKVDTVMSGNFLGHDVRIHFEGTLNADCSGDRGEASASGDIPAVDIQTSLPPGSLMQPAEKEAVYLEDLWWEIVWYGDKSGLRDRLAEEMECEESRSYQQFMEQEHWDAVRKERGF